MPKKEKLVVEIEVDGLEELKETLDIEKETTVFKANIGPDMKFEGTKSDFEAYIDGTIRFLKVAQLFQK